MRHFKVSQNEPVKNRYGSKLTGNGSHSYTGKDNRYNMMIIFNENFSTRMNIFIISQETCAAKTSNETVFKKFPDAAKASGFLEDDKYYRQTIQEGLLRYNHKPFGGKLFIIGADFREVLPVVEQGQREDVVEACVRHSVLWPLFTVHCPEVTV
ncbi:hypothetical protein ANCDUO_08561 [Ancylostoma duodenale]|uniref:ATP-dependent DNA helicase n=1 Tax=Ancylostoma duodenale TaxID=51022 RepID=A0A0C2CW71_9BILA|nr:hypothetical protein ANCDUO_08561 [Ancylostoma duodenale]